MSKDDWGRVEKLCRKCPICGKRDYCLLAKDGSAVICGRVVSDKRCGQAGWLHRLVDRNDWTPHPRRIVLRPRPRREAHDLEAIAIRLQHDTDVFEKTEPLAESLGLSAQALRRLGVGWNAIERCWTFPLCDSKGRTVGLIRRFADGTKRIMPGYHSGLHMPKDLPADMSGHRAPARQADKLDTHGAHRCDAGAQQHSRSQAPMRAQTQIERQQQAHSARADSPDNITAIRMIHTRRHRLPL